MPEALMKKEVRSWKSTNLDREMHVACYGYYGYALLMFPTSDSNYMEYEKSGLIDSISGFINSGTLKAYSIDSVNTDCWFNKKLRPEEKAIRHRQYNSYIEDELVPFINNESDGKIPIVVCGAYDLKPYTGGYYDDNCYFNSPVDYLPNLNDEAILRQMRGKSIIIASGRGDFEEPEASIALSNILKSKGISHWLDLWGNDMSHDWPTWQKMLPYFLESINV
jgi:esterase/lipase superfamily enzyme